MHTPGPLGLLLIAVVVLVLFGRGKVSSLMGEVGKGITAFKKGINDGQAEAAKEAEVAPPPVVAKDVTPADDKQA
ncbi:twin-arginine translocase TatA/TatE family subunit [Rhodobacter sp. KR11]|jgi:sec-independent protein translocase protein TatA|uniref:twin-arginine translocase TatA/TatE family subunit n=1 Tax=Rhodobacter sp. KR11 TaxID=2974588 RepID=UPI00222289F0|nr:twin-arginine translocase TatA/TatE family subunit [Rhodobacter sp. KR11]MCW1919502.1 twin-arginine translocase TatA/TatE family subunit [Rhodobacter sp. KR11]